jgi:hypothetical protein
MVQISDLNNLYIQDVLEKHGHKLKVFIISST